MAPTFELRRLTWRSIAACGTAGFLILGGADRLPVLDVTSARERLPHAAIAHTQSETVPTHVAWKLFCMSIGVERVSDADISVRLVNQFNATPAEAQQFIDMSKAFVVKLRTAEQASRRLVAEAFPATAPKPRPDGSEVVAIRLPPGDTSVKEVLARTGHLERAALRHAAVGDDFVRGLQRQLSAETFHALESWVSEIVLPRITTSEVAPLHVIPPMQVPIDVRGQ